MKLGVISDTHGLFDAAINDIFAGVDAILHAGDIGKLEVIKRLEAIAPVFAVEGNNDWFGAYPTERLEAWNGQRVLIRHIFGELHQLDQAAFKELETMRPDVLVFGHSHRPYQQQVNGTLLFNPGSAGPRRFTLPRTVGLLTLEPTSITAKIISLDGREGSGNNG
ncbi:MAG TPA: metallophosphoesterase family protein [Blastocatellia bacterium]|nr:metallophosphoesterase family protein [Blastocatellia bacterium]